MRDSIYSWDVIVSMWYSLYSLGLVEDTDLESRIDISEVERYMGY